MVQLWAQLSTRCLDYTKRRNKNCSSSVDTDFHDILTTLSSTVMPGMADIPSYMKYCHNATSRLPKMQDQPSVMLCYHSFGGWGKEGFALVFAPQGGQYSMYGFQQQVAIYMTKDAQPEIVNTPLTRTFRMGLSPCRFLLCL